MTESMAEKKYVRILAYREWAKSAAERITDAVPGWSVTTYNNEASGKEYGTDRVDAVLAIGWSWLVEQPRRRTAGPVPILIFHPSPLPLYRGGSPIQHQIIAGETQSALTVFEAGGSLDTGPIFSQRGFSLEGTLADVLKRIEDMSVIAGTEALNAIADGTYTTYPQAGIDTVAYRRRKPTDAEVTPEMLATMDTPALYNFVRCQQPPYPQAFMRGNDGSTLLLTARLPSKEDLAQYGVNSQGVPPAWRDGVRAAQARGVE